MRPQRPYRALRAAVGTIVVLAVVGLWAHAQFTGESLDMMWQLAALVIVLAGTLAVFGKGTFDAATSAAKEIGGKEENTDDK